MKNIWENLFRKTEDTELGLKGRYYAHSNNIVLRLPEGKYTFSSGEHGYGEALDIMKDTCKLSGLKYNHIEGRGPDTGRGYGDLHFYMAEKPEDNSLIAEIKLYSREFFTQYSGIGLYSPLLSEQEIKSINKRFPRAIFIEPELPSIASIDDKVLRLFVANFYEVLNNRKR